MKVVTGIQQSEYLKSLNISRINIWLVQCTDSLILTSLHRQEAVHPGGH